MLWEGKKAMSVVGSPEWFHENSLTKEMEEHKKITEERREKFIERFSPEKLLSMRGTALLQNVFGKDPSSMMRLLMFDGDYRLFGAAGPYAYLGIVFYDGENWKYNEKNKEESRNYLSLLSASSNPWKIFVINAVCSSKR